MKILGHRIAASALSVVGVLGFGVGVGIGPTPPPLRAQVPGGAGAGAVPKAAVGANQAGAAAAGAAALPTFPAWAAAHIAPQSLMSPQGMWAEVVSSTPRWLVVQNRETGQQFPIASDRVNQFLVRWPSSTNEISPDSLVEATGFRNGADTMVVDHVDFYENNAKSLVTPTLQNLGGGTADPLGMASPLNQANFNSINFETLNFGAVNWTELRPAGAANWTELPAFPDASFFVHVVGQPLRVNPNITLGGFGGNNLMNVAPDANSGMVITQVTLGTNSYAKKGDLLHLIPNSATPRGLDVAQLILYKQISLRQFQP